MLQRAAEARRVRHVMTAALAAAVVYLSTPREAMTGTGGAKAAPPLSADAVTCPTELFVLDNNQMYDVDQATGTVTGARAFCPGGPGFAAFYVDAAPDGSYWGTVSPNCGGAWQWGRVEPDAVAAGGNATGIIPLAPLPFAHPRMRPSFVADMPSAGSPIGYRFHPRPPSPECPAGASIDACALDLFAVDTLSPYSEHLVAADVGPVRFNFSIGSAVSADGSNVFHVTTDAVYCYGAGPLCPGTVSTGKIQQIGFLRLYNLSRNAVVLGSNEGNVFYIADGGTLFRYDVATGDVTLQPLPPLSQIVSGSRRPCVPGGVRIEATEAELITSETGGSATFTVVLTAAPTADVTVGFTSSNTSEGTVSPASVTFTTADWNVPKTITVTGVNDGVADAPQAYTIVTSDAASSDPNYSGRGVLDVPVRNYIDFPPTIVASSQSLLAGMPLSGVTLATVSDIEDSPASLSVSATSVHADLALGPLVNTGGVITADLAASCGAASATRTITLQVTDGAGNVRTTNVPITVTADQAPSIGWYGFPGPTIAQGGGAVLSPNFAPDPTFLDTFTVTPVAGYTGSATLDRATGNVTLANAGPRGVLYFVVRATSFCGSTTSYYAYAVVQNDAPTLGSYANATVAAGAGTTVVASGGPGDDGSIAGMSVSAPGFTGTLSVDPSTGNVTVANADPPGSFVVQVKATDNWGLTGSASFTLTVDPPSPLPACTTALYTVLNDEPARLATVDGSGTVTAGPALSGLAFNSVLPVLAMDFSPGGALYAIVAKSDESLAWARIDAESGVVTELGPFASMPGDFTLGRSPAGPVRGYMTELSPIPCSPPCSSAQVDSVRSIQSLNPLATSFYRLTNSGSAASWPPLLSAPRGLPALALSRDEQTLFALGTLVPDVAYSYDVANPRELTNSGLSIAGYTTGSLRTTIDARPDADLFTFFHGSVAVTADPLSGNTATALSQAVRGVAAWRRCANAPVIGIATPPSLEQGAAASAKSVGSVRDATDAAGSIATSAPVIPAGLTIAAPSNSGGAVTASMSAACSAPLGRSFATFRATDSSGLFADEALPVDVTANQPPVVGYAAARVRLGAGGTVTPATALADAGSIASVTATSPTFTGTLTGSAANGAITVAAAAPAGNHTVTVVATDNCGATTSTTFTLTVDAPPSIATSSPSVQAGSPAASAALGTIADAEDAAGILTVAATSVPAGLTLGAITNTGGALTAALSASCSATPGTHALGLEVTDSAGNVTAGTVTVTVTADVSPTLGAYAGATLVPGASTVVTPGAAPADNGSLASVTAAAPGFGGTLAVNATSGAVTIGSATPAGVFTVTVTATDNCGKTATSSFSLSVNTPPAVTPATGVTVQQGSPAATVAIGSASDPEQSAGAIVVTAGALPAGITLGPIANSGGALTASLSASCLAAIQNHAVSLTAADGAGGSTTVNLTFAVTANAPPSLGAYAPLTLSTGAGASASPGAAPADNGTIASVTVAAPGFAGTVSVDASTGALTIANASPAGAHTITVTATDQCGAASTATLALRVDAIPAIAPALVAVTKASPASAVTLATVSDLEDPAGSLTVTATGIPAGLTLGAITNVNGTIAASLAASCATPTGAQTITLQVADSRGQTAAANVTVTVAANPPPALGTYVPLTLPTGGGAVASPSAAPSDNGTVTSVSVAAPSVSGTVSVDAAGAITIANASPAGAHSITVTATDDCGATSAATLALTVDAVPSITAATPIAVQRGSAASTVTLATVSDAEDAAGSLAIVATSVPAGLILGPLTNANGTIAASVTASCAATTGAQTITLQVTDSRGQTSSASVTLNVSANTPPVLGAYAPLTLANGAGTIASPSGAPADNGTIASVTVAAPGFGGTVSVDAGTGAITIANASPAGPHTLTVTATDDCGATSTATLSLTVDAGPAIVAASPLALTQASPAGVVTLATVSDAEDAAGSLTVTATSVPAGIALGTITNTNGILAASLAASCAATTGAQTIALQVTDSRGQSASASVTLNVGANPPPVLGTYTPSTLSSGASITIAPSAPPSDNGSIASVTVAATGFAGTASVDAATGAITIANASPRGPHSLTVTATDDCGATSTATLALTVDGGPAIAAAPPIALTQASPAIAVTLATVSDAEDAAGSLTVTATSVPAGITLGALTNVNGTITASLAASCAAPTGAQAITLQVADGRGQSATANVTVNVAPNPPPLLGTYAPLTLPIGGGAVASPSAAPSDNVTVASVSVAAPGFSGTVIVDAAGTITIANASPAGLHTITVTATDDCGATAAATLALTIDGAPSIAASAPIAVQQASGASTVSLATVGDVEDAAGSLAVVATSVPAGITLGPLANANGAVSASIAASCMAPPGPQALTLRVTDSRGLTSSANVTVNVSANSPPLLGTYAPVTLVSGGGTIASPTAPPSDNGTIASLTVAAPGFGGTVSVDAATGAITIAGAGPAGDHTITVTATDDCGAVATAALTVSVPAVSIAELSPAGACQNAPPLELAVVGSGFQPGMRVLWNGTPRPTTFAGPARLAISVTAADLAAAAVVSIAIANGAGASLTPSIPFTIASDATAPVVDVPTPIALVESLTDRISSAGPHGATPATSARLRAFLAAAGATDFCSAVRDLGASANGVPVGDATLFAPGTTPVLFAFADATGNTGTGESAVTVWRYGSLVAPGRDPGAADLLVLANVVAGRIALESARFPAPAAAADLDHDGTIDALDLALFHDYLDPASEPLPGPRRRMIVRTGPGDPSTYPLTIDSPGATLGAFVATVRFDPARVELVAVEPGSAGEFERALEATAPAAANRTGVLIVAGAQTSAASPRGSVEVARLRFREVAAGGLASVSVGIDSAAALPAD